MPEIDYFSRLAVALAIGLMVGIERGWKSREAEEDGRAAGLRTFGLSGLTGGICGVLTETLGAPFVGIAYWRAANYLTVGQIYVLNNPLLREQLRIEHVKPRLLGHWGTSPGLNFIYAHLNWIIRLQDANIIYVCGPGHGGPAMVANTWLEGTYS